MHRGEYAEHDVAGRTELIGPDVVLAHRLLKNSIREETGIASYAFFTDSAFAGAATPQDSREHSERYDDAGEVDGRVIDLAAMWKREQTEREVKVPQGEEDFEWDE